MKLVYRIFLVIFLIISGCKSKSVIGTYASIQGPYFSLDRDLNFTFGVPGDPAPLRGKYKITDDQIYMKATSRILDDMALTEFECTLNEDTLTIDKLSLSHPKFQIFINKKFDYAKTVRDTIVKEFKLSDPEAPEELYVYYTLVHIKFIKS